MFLRQIYTTLFALLFFTINCKAQDPVYRTINSLTGLPCNSIYNILQDSVGYIWIGHDKGLTRYDGREFVNYAAKGQQGKSLSNLIEIKGTIWCQDFSGNLYYTKNNDLILVKGFKSKGVYSPARPIGQKKLCFFNADSIRCLDLERNQSGSLFTENTPMYPSTYDKERGYYLDSSNICSYDGRQIKLEYKAINKNFETFHLLKVGGSFFGVARNKYPYIRDLITGKELETPALKPGLFIQSISETKGEFWFSTSSGAYCFDKNLKPKYGGKCFFPNESISTVLKDKEGNYWFCTLSNGILFSSDINVDLYRFNQKSITCISRYNTADQLLLGTSTNDILIFDLKNNQSKQIFKSKFNHEVVEIDYDSSRNNIIFCSDKIYYLNNFKNNKIINISGKSIYPINNNLYALAYGSGISLIPAIGDSVPVPQWLRYKYDNWNAGHYFIESNGERGRAVLYDSSEQTLYAATAGGLLYFSPEGNGELHFKGKTIYSSCIIKNKKALIIGTFSEGLFLYQNGEMRHLNEQNQQLSNTIYKLAEDDEYIWILGDEYLQRYNLSNNELVHFDYSDGLPKSEIEDMIVYGNKLFVATADGLVSFDTRKKSVNNIAPKIVITDILVNNKKSSLGAIDKLQNNQNNIIIKYSVVAFRGNESVNVQYRINNNNWQNTDGKSNQIALLSLTPDDYVIELRAFNEDGVTEPETLKLEFSIAAPLYKQPLFIVLVGLAIVALMYIYFKTRLINERKNNKLKDEKNQLEKELQQSMLSSIKSQMNPHFIFNALNTIQSYIYTNDRENASEYLGKFSELTRMILDMSNREIVCLADEIKALKLYIELEQLRFEDKLRYEFIIDDNVSVETSFIPSMLIQPYVENAIKHGLLHQKGNWLLLVRFTKAGDGIDVEVEDNGVGRKRSAELNKSKKHQSFATKANQKRLEILNKDVKNMISIKFIDKSDEFGNPRGTKVLIHIPFVQLFSENN